MLPPTRSRPTTGRRGTGQVPVATPNFSLRLVEPMHVRREPRRSTRSTRPLVLEVLEGRCVPTTVTNLNDAGPGSLRQAVLDTPTTGTVDFAERLGGTITLTSAPLTINKIIRIDGPGASVITVSGNRARQVFNIPAPWTVTISGLTIANGLNEVSP